MDKTTKTGAVGEFVKAISGFKFASDKCLYCDSPDRRIEADHFPIPAALGGGRDRCAAPAS